MKKSMVALFLVGCMLCTLFAACTPAGTADPADGANGKPVAVRVMWWGSQARHDSTIKMIAMFMEKNPDVMIEYEYGGFDTYWDKITSMMAAGNAPDVFQNSVAYILGHAQSDQLIPLDPYIESSDINLSDWDDVFKQLGVIDGKTYGLALGNAAYSLLYDPVLFQEAGLEAPGIDWTWDNYLTALQTIKEKTGKYGDTCFPASMIEGYFMYLRQNGYPGLFNESRDGLAYEGTDLWVELFTMQKEMIEKGYVTPYDQTLDSMTSIELSGVATGTSGLLGIINSNQAVAIATAKNAPVGITSYPHAPGEKQAGNFIGPTMFFSVPKSTQQPKAAARFMNFMLNDIEANKIAMMEKGVPASASVREALEPLLPETSAMASQYVGEVAKFAVPFDNIYPTCYSQVLDLYKKLVEDMMFDRISIEEAGVKFNTEVKALLQAAK